MELNSDLPITKLEEDALGRANFAKSLAQMVCSAPVDESFAVGLYGKWGSGKTSVINMVVEHIPAVKKREDEELPLIVRFEPWNYVSVSQLTEQFFKALIQALKVKNGNKVMQTAGAILETYASAAEFLEVVPTLGAAFKIVNTISARAGARMMERGKEKERDLASCKDDVIKHLRKLDRRIIVIIDDIDRLTNEQIRMIFQLVCSIAKFPKIVYLLAFDREIVCKALEDVQGCDGEEYLEKVIQFPLAIPEAKKAQIETILFAKLNQMLGNSSTHLFDQQHWHKVYPSCISPKINSIRGVNRFLNTFSMMHASLGDEIDFSDLAAMSALQVWEPELQNWIFRNSDLLLGGSVAVFSVGNDLAKDEQRFLRLLEAQLQGEKIEYAKGFVSAVFPKAKQTLSRFYSGETEAELYAKGRVASRACLELVMHHSINDVAIPKGEIEHVLRDLNADDLSLVLGKYASDGVLRDFSISLAGLQDDLSVERYPEIVEAILRSLGKTYEPITAPFDLPTDSRLQMAVEKMLLKLGQPNAEAVLSGVLDKLDDDNVMAFASLLNSQEIDHGRYGEGQNQARQAVSSSYLDELERFFLERIGVMSKQGNLLERSDSSLALAVWEKLDKEAHDKYVSKALEASDKAIAVFATRRMGRWYGDSNMGWSTKTADGSLVANEGVVSSINRFRLQQDFWNLAEQDQEKMATVVISASRSDDFDNISDNEARDLLTQWRAEYELGNQ